MSSMTCLRQVVSFLFIATPDYEVDSLTQRKDLIFNISAITRF